MDGRSLSNNLFLFPSHFFLFFPGLEGESLGSVEICPGCWGILEDDGLKSSGNDDKNENDTLKKCRLKGRVPDIAINYWLCCDLKRRKRFLAVRSSAMGSGRWYIRR